MVKYTGVDLDKNWPGQRPPKRRVKIGYTSYTDSGHLESTKPDACRCSVTL